VTDQLTPLLGGTVPPGVYRWDSDLASDEIRRRCTAAGWVCQQLDGWAARDKSELLARLGAALRFPAGYGRNWDAAYDCLIDLSWLEGDGVVLLWEAPESLATPQPATFRTAADVLGTAIRARRSLDLPPLYILVRSTGGVLVRGSSAVATLTPLPEPA
jgi:hypothetical protein